MSAQFNRKTEKKGVKGRLSGNEISSWLNDLTFPPPGKGHSKMRAFGYGKTHNWTHSPILFELPYWVTLSVRHCLDVMHTEKNVFENLFYTVLDASGKTKDNDNARKDLEALNIRPELWLRTNNTKPKAPFCLTKQQVEDVCLWVSGLKLPDGYASNISRCTNVEQLKINGFKSHDCHVFMQKLMPIAFREMLPRKVLDALTELSNFFRDICSTVIRYSDVEQMENNIVLTICKLEMVFPPGFFDSMEHLPIHLPYELKLGGPVQYRWMYPFERYMRRLKQKVKNKAHVEGSIAERYTEEELVNFCSLYFDDVVSTKHNRLSRNEVVGPQSHADDELAVFTYPTKPFGHETMTYLSDKDLKIVSTYVLLNMPEVSSYINSFEEEAYASNPALTAAQLEAFTTANFQQWFKTRVDEENISERFRDVIRGPYKLVSSFPGCIVNGYRFKVDNLNDLTSVNSGVVVLGSCYHDSESNYYGRLEDVVVLNYPGGKKVVTFKCRWFDTEKGIKVDRNRIVTVDIKSKLKSDDVFVLASQATQVYYASNVVNSRSPWYTVVTTKTRAFDGANMFGMDEALQEDVSNPREVLLNDEDVMTNDVVDVPDDEEVEDFEVVNEYVIVEDDNDDETDIDDDDEEETESDNDIDVESDGFDDVQPLNVFQN